MFKKVVLLASIGVAILLTGCSSSAEIEKLNKLKALNSESTTDTYNLTTSEKEEAVYAQVIARQLLDFSVLDSCSDNDKQQVLQFMNTADSQLCGTLQGKDGVMNDKYINYLLLLFERTPYYWQRKQTTIKGIDAESRSIVVDVTYRTIDFKKDVQGASYLVQGEPGYDKKMQVRYSRWAEILSDKYSGSGETWNGKYKKFVDVYGDPKDIVNSQRNLSLSESIYETGNQKTYTGLVNTDEENSGGTLVIRYVLTPSYVLGINNGMTCDHMYLVSYTLDNDCTANLELFKDDGYATISDNIYELIHSYFTCMDESDYSGLYKLTKNFGDLDKYYSDYFDSTYRKHENFTVSLFDIAGTRIKCGVSISTKERTKGSNMTLPNYTERYYFELELVDKSLKVTNMVLLSSILEGEPAISTSDAETTGFISSVDLNNTDKKDIESLISQFGAIQLLGDTSSDNFGSVVDLSMSQSQLDKLKTNMASVSGVKKVVWLVNYMQGTTNYASVKCRELYQREDNSISEVQATYDFIHKGGKWYIYSYNVNSSIVLDTTNLVTSSSLCVCSAGKVDMFTSQIVNTEGSGEVHSLENIGTTYDHEPYTPTLKSGVSEQGFAKLSKNKITEDEFISVYNTMLDNYSLQSSTNLLSLDDLGKLDSDIKDADSKLYKNTKILDTIKEFCCVYFNYMNNRYMDVNDLRSEKDAVATSLSNLTSTLYAIINTTDSKMSKVHNIDKFLTCLDGLSHWIDGLSLEIN